MALTTVLRTNVLHCDVITLMPPYTSSAFTRWRHHRLRLRTSDCSLLLIYLPRKDEMLSRPGWLTYSRRFTHINGHPSAVAQVRESSPVKDQRSTTAPCNQPTSMCLKCGKSHNSQSNQDVLTMSTTKTASLLTPPCV